MMLSNPTGAAGKHQLDRSATPAGNILFLGPADSPLIAWLRDQGENVAQTDQRISPEVLTQNQFTFLISFGYRHLISKAILDLFPDRAINLHISYLPWNRGSDPNLWSFIEGSPKGVTIHHLDEGVDTGDIIAQEEIVFDSDLETLATSYEHLALAVQELFKRNWPMTKNGSNQRCKQIGAGSAHKVKDREVLSHLLTRGWNTPVSVLLEFAAETEMSEQFWEKYDSEIEEIRDKWRAMQDATSND